MNYEKWSFQNVLWKFFASFEKYVLQFQKKFVPLRAITMLGVLPTPLLYNKLNIYLK